MPLPLERLPNTVMIPPQVAISSTRARLPPLRHCWDLLARAGGLRCFVVILVAAVAAGGCEHPFQAFEENANEAFSMFGYLDLKADTQWVRVMPVRHNLLVEPKPIDGVVTLEHLGTGRIVTFNDSLFRYEDPRLDGVVYAHNFWTTERLEPTATYRLRATRSDGAWTEATVDLPDDFEFTFLNDVLLFPERARLAIRADNLLFAEVVSGMGSIARHPITGALMPGEPAGTRTRRSTSTFDTGDPGTVGIGLDGDQISYTGLLDLRRQWIRVVVARPDWPYHAELPDLVVTLPNTMPSNVERGFGFVGGVATRTIPFHRCRVLETSANRESPCTIRFDAQSATISGRVMREPCGTPHALADIRLTERFAGGGAVIRSWKTGWGGEYRFEGIEPNADLVLDLGPGTPQVSLPRLARGERHVAGNVSAAAGC